MKRVTCTLYSTWCIMICLVILILSLLLFIQSLYSLSKLLHLLVTYHTLHSLLAFSVPLSAVTCPRLMAPTNGQVAHQSLELNSVATYSCNPGYVLEGGATRLCLLDGSWGGQAPLCKREFVNTLDYIVVLTKSHFQLVPLTHKTL